MGGLFCWIFGVLLVFGLQDADAQRRPFNLPFFSGSEDRAAGAGTTRLPSLPYDTGFDVNALNPTRNLDFLEQIRRFTQQGPIDMVIPPDVWSGGAITVNRTNSLLSMGPLRGMNLSLIPSALRSLPLPDCGCEQLMCRCCFTVLNNTGCTGLGYDPEGLALILRISANNRTIFEREILSGKNPPPVCAPLPFFPVLNVCFRLYNISLVNSQFQVCGAADSGIAFGPPLIRLRFGCLRAGMQGLSWTQGPGIEIPLVEGAVNRLNGMANTANRMDGFFQTLLQQQQQRRQQQSTGNKVDRPASSFFQFMN